MLGAQHHVLEVGPVERVPALLGRLEEGGGENAPGVVHEYADRSELRDGVGECRINLS
jgi:hypothetical protein